MKTSGLQAASLIARTSGLADPRLAILTVCTDVMDVSTWEESSEFGGAGRISLAGLFSAPVRDGELNSHVSMFPTTEISVLCSTGFTAVRLAICDGTGSLQTAAKSVSDNPFTTVVQPNDELKILVNSQKTTEQ